MKTLYRIITPKNSEIELKVETSDGKVEKYYICSSEGCTEVGEFDFYDFLNFAVQVGWKVFEEYRIENINT